MSSEARYETLLRLPEVIKRVGLSGPSIYRRIRAKQFPAPVSLGGQAVAWPESEVSAWVSQQIAISRKPGQPGSGFVYGYGVPALSPAPK